MSQAGARSNITPDAGAFTKVRTRRGFEYISEQIRTAIANGTYKPGERLPTERHMVEIFGVSRQGVREALRGLEMSGLVVSRPGASGGVFVRRGDPEVITRAMSDLVSVGALSPESLLEARILLTEDVIRLACTRATSEDLAQLDDDIAQFEIQQNDLLPSSARVVRITDFYRLLAEASHNEVLVMLTNSLTEIVQQRVNNVGPDPLANVAQMRRKFMKALRNADADASVAQMTAHLNRVEAQLIKREKEQQGRVD